VKYKEVLEEVLLNLRCIDMTENEQVESYVDDSIRIIKEALAGHEKTAKEVQVQLSQIRTKELAEELKKREGVKTTIAEPYKDIEVKVNGPAIVLVLID
jgi:translation initiation factor 1 (eIF-1/SUI1)